ncbi:hypothetical protein [Sphingomicrobium sediminis]|uniref:Uncharacterized protein n=1 Tax=Sphingomicrobium sediminis TaxID=2950949 RepID=A0A9X2EME2_9SPHN|nr:hypothetical protein [Sphingomicrobium sediminis]MCM8558059.1 hypothetical protein [Sphingomicrobium sediminis]
MTRFAKFSIALLAGAMLATPLAGEVKPPPGKGGGNGGGAGEEEPTGPLELAYEDYTNRDGEFVTLSSLALSNRQRAVQPGEIGQNVADAHYVNDALIRLVTTGYDGPDRPIFVVDVNLDANGNILTTSTVRISDYSRGCNDLSDDGLKVTYIDYLEQNVMMADASGGPGSPVYPLPEGERYISCDLLSDGDGSYTLYGTMFTGRDAEGGSYYRIDRVDLTTQIPETVLPEGLRVARLLAVSPDQNSLAWDTDDSDLFIIDDLAAGSSPRLIGQSGTLSRPDFLCDNEQIFVAYTPRASRSSAIYTGNGLKTVSKKWLRGANTIC